LLHDHQLIPAADLPVKRIVGLFPPALVGGYLLPDLYGSGDSRRGVGVKVGGKAADQPAHFAAALRAKQKTPGHRALRRLVERWIQRPIGFGKRAAELVAARDSIRA